MSATSATSKDSEFPSLQRLTPVLVVESVRDCLPFWTDRLGFELTNHVPGPDGSMIFAILERSGIEVMYQSSESVLADGTITSSELSGHSVACSSPSARSTMSRNGSPARRSSSRATTHSTEAPRST